MKFAKYYVFWQKNVKKWLNGQKKFTNVKLISSFLLKLIKKNLKYGINMPK